MECAAAARPKKLQMDVEAILGCWDTLAALARDIEEAPETVRMWRYRKWIPPEYDFPIVKAARKRGYVMTLESIALIRECATEAPPDDDSS